MQSYKKKTYILLFFWQLIIISIGIIRRSYSNSN